MPMWNRCIQGTGQKKTKKQDCLDQMKLPGLIIDLSLILILTSKTKGGWHIANFITREMSYDA